jgi:hypothetical protein
MASDVERDVWIRGGMVLSIFSLVGLILVTPSLLGHPPPELASLPLLVIGMSKNESTFIVNLASAVQTYRYDLIRFTINGTQTWGNRTVSWNGTWSWTDTYGDHTWVPANASFSVDVYLIDHSRNFFEYNVSAHTEKDLSGNTVMVFTFPYEADNRSTVIRRTPPAEDFRWVIPRRGTLP